MLFLVGALLQYQLLNLVEAVAGHEPL